MNLKNISKLTLILALIVGFSSCKKDEGSDPAVTVVNSTSFDYKFNNGQIVETSSYVGMHPDNLSSTMKVEELSNGKTRISVTLKNTLEGKKYMIHAHDAADPATTPNGTPYNESPNSMVFTQMAMGNGSDVTATQTTDMTYKQITETYAAFFVVHDPLQVINTADITTYVVLGSFARTQPVTSYMSKEFMYDFNNGQVAAAYAYDGAHAKTLTAKLRVQEIAGGKTRITTILMNTKNGEKYMIHAHDAADPATTPNKTPYNETPNIGLCTVMVMGNGSTNWNSQLSKMSYSDITATYSGFFVVHDPLQAIDTTDPTTYVILGSFAR